MDCTHGGKEIQAASTTCPNGNTPVIPSHPSTPTPVMDPSSGMTTKSLVMMIGLFTGVIVIGILCAIALPKYNQTKLRAMVSRSNDELKNLATAVESYYVDYCEYPVSMDKMTTPINFLPAKINDPFSRDKKEPYLFFAGPATTSFKSYYIVAGRGPDGKLGLNGDTSIYQNYSPEKGYAAAGIIEYDPTNGIISAGDILRSTYSDTSTVSGKNSNSTSTSVSTTSASNR